MILEAVCRKCGETFNPNGEEDGFDAGTPEHYTTADGEECGGTGDITGSWGYDPKVDYRQKLKDAGVPILRTSTGFKLG